MNPEAILGIFLLVFFIFVGLYFPGKGSDHKIPTNANNQHIPAHTYTN